MDTVWAILLVALGGLLVGGAISTWRSSRAIAVILAICAALAVAAGVLRMDY